MSKDDDKKTVKAKVGQDIVLTLKAEGDTEWKVTKVDRTLGQPKAGGDTFTWATKSPLDVSGKHTVEMELRDKKNPKAAAKQKFSVTFEIAK